MDVHHRRSWSTSCRGLDAGFVLAQGHRRGRDTKKVSTLNSYCGGGSLAFAFVSPLGPPGQPANHLRVEGLSSVRIDGRIEHLTVVTPADQLHHRGMPLRWPAELQSQSLNRPPCIRVFCQRLSSSSGGALSEQPIVPSTWCERRTSPGLPPEKATPAAPLGTVDRCSSPASEGAPGVMAALTPVLLGHNKRPGEKGGGGGGPGRARRRGSSSEWAGLCV